MSKVATYAEVKIRECLEENGRDPDEYITMSAERRLRWYCLWVLGDMNWADDMIQVMREVGYTVEAPNA